MRNSLAQKKSSWFPPVASDSQVSFHNFHSRALLYYAQRATVLLLLACAVFQSTALTSMRSRHRSARNIPFPQRTKYFLRTWNAGSPVLLGAG